FCNQIVLQKGDVHVKKTAIVMLIALFLGLLTSPAFAGGDKNRGDKGQGTVVQKQVRVNK
ncbi:MAG: hypothetical protein ACMUIS_06060, partial [bacterium]